ncbi:hypothetical protein CP533_3645 [Ophiocordyceps camponoti-saundersi (nom. inval.)]|nr:hypothetical protein CP533_3645 [Ophiocordyceps camponoti-saundersi (nom. inval.)]
METYHGFVRAPADAIKLFEACRLGLLPRVQRRLSEKERQSIRSGSVFVWDEREAGMRRWTDGKSWSASRVSGSFLTYREMEGKRGGGFGGGSNGGNSNNNANGRRGGAGKTPDSGRGSDEDHDDAEPEGYRYKADGLMKQSFSLTTSTGQHLHLISYYTRPHAGQPDLPQPTTDPNLRNVMPPKGMYPESSMGETNSTPAMTRTPMTHAYLQHHHAPFPYPAGQPTSYGWPPSPASTPPFGHYATAQYPGHPHSHPHPHPHPPSHQLPHSQPHTHSQSHPHPHPHPAAHSHPHPQSHPHPHQQPPPPPSQQQQQQPQQPQHHHHHHHHPASAAPPPPPPPPASLQQQQQQPLHHHHHHQQQQHHHQPPYGHYTHAAAPPHPPAERTSLPPLQKTQPPYLPRSHDSPRQKKLQAAAQAVMSDPQLKPGPLPALNACISTPPTRQLSVTPPAHHHNHYHHPSHHAHHQAATSRPSLSALLHPTPANSEPGSAKTVSSGSASSSPRANGLVLDKTGANNEDYRALRMLDRKFCI